MDRKSFLQGSLLTTSSLLLAGANGIYGQSLQEANIDTLVDAQGNYQLQPLPYREEFLEPYMDAETVHLHHTFHHGGAVTAANKDLQMILRASKEGNLETLDYWTKKLSYHFSSHILHTIFWTNLGNRKTEPGGDLLKRIEKNFGSYDALKN